MKEKKEVIPWAKKYDKCIKCGKNDKPHRQEGYCTTCWGGVRYSREKETLSIASKKYYEKNKEKIKEKRKEYYKNNKEKFYRKKDDNKS